MRKSSEIIKKNWKWLNNTSPSISFVDCLPIFLLQYSINVLSPSLDGPQQRYINIYFQFLLNWHSCYWGWRRAIDNSIRCWFQYVVQCTLRVWDATTDAGWLMLCHRIIRSSASLLSPSMCISEWFCCYLFCRSWAEARNDIKMQTRYNKYVYICQCKIYLPYNNMDSFSLSLFFWYIDMTEYTHPLYFTISSMQTHALVTSIMALCSRRQCWSKRALRRFHSVILRSRLIYGHKMCRLNAYNIDIDLGIVASMK